MIPVLSTVTYPAGSQNVCVTFSRRLPALVVVGLPGALAESTVARVRAALGSDMPRCRVVVEVIRPGGAYACPEVDAAIVAGVRHLNAAAGLRSTFPRMSGGAS